MLFSDLYKSPKSPLAKLRHSNIHPQRVPDSSSHDADLVSRDKVKQKEAVKKYLAERVRNDWHFSWRSTTRSSSNPEVPAPAPRAEAFVETQLSGMSFDADGASGTISTAPTALHSETAKTTDASGTETGSEAGSLYSIVSEDPVHYRTRDEWLSELSDTEASPAPASPFRFDSPEAVGTAVQAEAIARKAKRRRAVREEATWNEGLACFNARRDAWTEARTVRVKPRPMSPVSPSSPRRALWRFHSHSKSESATSQAVTQSPWPASPGVLPLSRVTSASRHSQHSAPDATTPLASDGDSHNSNRAHGNPRADYPVEILLPTPAPILPMENPMRASIAPNIYVSLYDKVVVNNMQPSCPINLTDMVRSCVAGWKRDGEWPPIPAEVPSAAVVVVRKKKKKDERASGVKDHLSTTTNPGRRLSFSALLGRAGSDDRREIDKDHDKQLDESTSGKGIRRSLQRVLGLGSHSHISSVGGPTSNEPVLEDATSARRRSVRGSADLKGNLGGQD